jgi:hypothetical protein
MAPKDYPNGMVAKDAAGAVSLWVSNASSRPFIGQMSWMPSYSSNNLARVFIIPHSYEFYVPDMGRICPFQELESGNSLSLRSSVSAR